MGNFEGVWQEVPEIVKWVDSANEWVDFYRVYEFKSSASIRLKNPTGFDLLESLYQKSEHYIWTISEYSIKPGRDTDIREILQGSIRGWYVSENPWGTNRDSEAPDFNLKTSFSVECPACKGESCEFCDDYGAFVLDLHETDFALLELD